MQQSPVFPAARDLSCRAGTTVGLALIALFSVHAGFEVLVVGILMMSLAMASETACRAMTTLGSALSTARTPAVPSADDVLGAAQEAFMETLQRGTGVGAAVATSGAILALHYFRKARQDAPELHRPA